MKINVFKNKYQTQETGMNERIVGVTTRETRILRNNERLRRKSQYQQVIKAVTIVIEER